MAYIRTVDDKDAEGDLKPLYDAAVNRAGKVFGIVRLMSPNPAVLEASMGLYRAVMFGPSPLSRRQREMMATVVSAVNGCHYWMHAHAADFRSEVEDGDGDADTLSEGLLHDWRRAPLPAPDRALCAYAEKLALEVDRMGPGDLEPLRAAGFDDRAIHDATHVVSYFSYINRVAEGLGVDLEPGMPPRAGDAGKGLPDAEGEESLLRAAGEAMGMEKSFDTGSFSIAWECTRCRRYFPAGRPLPRTCDSCGTERTEFVPSEGR